MATNYPGGLDDHSILKNDAVDATVTSITHPAAHNNVADAIIAIETALGVSPAGAYASVAAALLNAIFQTPTADQTIQPSSDHVALIVKAGSNLFISDLFEAKLFNGSVVAFIDKNGNFSAQGLKINGTALAASHLSNGVQGSGAVVLATSPTITTPTISTATLTGVPVAPTPTGGDNSTKIATTAFVASAIAPLAPLNSPAFTGTPTAPTPALGDNSTKVATTAFVAQNGVPVGSMTMYGGVAAPSGWLLCDGSAVSRSTYGNLFSALVTSKGTFTVTIASPGVFTLNSHGLVVGDTVYLETTGALPTGLSADTPYYVVVSTTNTFQLSATRGGAAINTSGTQSGTHTCFYSPYAASSMGASTFNVPDMRGRMAAGYAASGGHADVAALGNGDPTALAHRRPKHTHTGPVGGLFGWNTTSANRADGGDAQNPFSTTVALSIGADPANDPVDAPAYLIVNYIIKT